MPKREKSFSRTGWEPHSVETFKKETMILLLDRNLKDFQDKLGNTVDGTPSNTFATKTFHTRSAAAADLKGSKLLVANARPEDRAQAVRNLRRAKRIRSKMKATLNLLRVAKNLRPRYVPQQLMVQGSPSTDRKAWLREAEDFGKARFGDAANSFQKQKLHLLALSSAVENGFRDDHFRFNMTFFDILNARAEMKPGKAAGVDNLPPEVFHQLPYVVVMKVWRLFWDYYRNLDHPAPPSWDRIEFVGLPKVRNMTTLEEFRWLSKLSVMWK